MMHTFNMSPLDNTPDDKHFPFGSCDLDSLQHHKILVMAIKEVFSMFVGLSYCDPNKCSGMEDHIQAYALSSVSFVVHIIVPCKLPVLTCNHVGTYAGPTFNVIQQGCNL